VNFEKTFEKPDWIQMVSILRSIRVDWRDRKLVAELYMRQDNVIRIHEVSSEPEIMGIGVRQSCLLSELLFSLCIEKMIGEAIEEVQEGINTKEAFIKRNALMMKSLNITLKKRIVKTLVWLLCIEQRRMQEGCIVCIHSPVLFNIYTSRK